MNEAIKNGGTHILFVDSDMIFLRTRLKDYWHKKNCGVKYKREFPVSGFMNHWGRIETEIFKVKHRNGIDVD